MIFLQRMGRERVCRCLGFCDSNNGITLRRQHGEAGSVDCELLASQRLAQQALIDEYDPADVYNFDETGLFFRLQPSQILATKSIAGKKKDKLPPVVIHKHKESTLFQRCQRLQAPF